ncbi:HYR domain-containing protein [Archangium gephyra]|uniref:FG-GAP-like repeat-containing protein n=1 Tax=Archangium gephyra TaxID=48 RepID=UPI0035D475C4
MRWESRCAGVLAASLLAACRTEAPAPEAEQGRQLAQAGPACVVDAPYTPSFLPEQQWEWTGSTVLPGFHRVLSHPVVVDVNTDGIPEVVFNSAPAEAVLSGSGPAVLRAIRGDTGQELWSVAEPSLRTQAARSIAAGDLDGDGRVELCTLSESALDILCFRGDGSLLLRIPQPARVEHGGELSLADLDGDGRMEILDGHRVYGPTGALMWTGAIPGTTAFGVDLDLDGTREVLNGPAVYRADGSLLCTTADVSNAWAGVGNFDADPQGEIIVAHGEQVSLFDTDCTHRWTATLEGSSFYAPNIADFDGDGLPEVGVGSAESYAVFETDGTLKWKVALDSLGQVWSTTFDFEGDGQLEVVLTDEAGLSIRDAATGVLRFQAPLGAASRQKTPLVVDVDADGSAEIVVATAVFRDRNEGWRDTRDVWNQPAYAVGLDTFHSNTWSPRTVPAPDLTVSLVSSFCDRDTRALELEVRVENLGDAVAPPGLKVAFYAKGTLLDVVTLTEALEPYASTEVTLSRHSPMEGFVEVTAVVDDDGTGLGRDAECNEHNNLDSGMVDLACDFNEGPVAVCQDVTVPADATCRGRASVNAGSYDPDSWPAPLTLSETPAGPFGPGAHAVTLLASDGEESARCVGTVTVVDDMPPSLSCPASRVLECAGGGVVATYAAKASDNCGPVVPTCAPSSGSTFPGGTTPVRCSATDGSGNMASCGFTVTVRDTRPPTPGAETGLSLWPPQHKYVTVTLAQCAASARDACSGELPLERYGRITRVTSDEVEDSLGLGDGHTCDDVDVTVGATSVQLRAEREGTSDGRVYTVHYTVADASGNSSAGSCRVSVPHDQSGKAALDSGPRYCVGEGCPAGQGGSLLCR